MSQSNDWQHTLGDTSSSGTPSSAPTAVASSRPMTTIPFDQPVVLSPSGEPLLNPRSCVTCRRRKVRCDKSMPCQNCRRAQISCVYPAPGRAPRRPRARDPGAPPRGGTTASERESQLLQRLRKLEGIVEELSGQMDESGGGPRTTSTSPETAQQQTTAAGHTERAGSAGHSIDGSPRSPASVGQKIGRLVLHDKEHTRRYVSNAFCTRLKDELDELRVSCNAHSQSEEDHSDDSSSASIPDDIPDVPPPSPPLDDHHAFLLGYSSADADLASLHPLPSQVPFLWQTFRENVDAMVKVFHTPTIERLLRETRRSPGAAAASATAPAKLPSRAADDAVLFTIYYCAVASMEDDEAEASFGSPKARLLARYRFGVEQGLARANILNTTDMTVLQALTVFLTVVRRHDDTKFCWTMTALAVRIAMALGLHRDGTQLGLSPLEVESRRRLWWTILALDLRSAEELGSDLIVAEGSFDTRLPTNVDDADLEGAAALSPGSPGPAPREGRTDMAVCLVRLEICALARRLHSMTGDMAAVNGGDEDAAASLAARDKMLSEVHARVEGQFLRHVIPAGAADGEGDLLFWVASLVARVVMAKIGLLIYQPVLFPGTGPALSGEIRDRLFASTVDIVEYNHVLNTDPRCRQWRWLFQTYRQWHAIAYMLLEVARRPWSATSERAWEAAAILEHEGHDLVGAAGADHTAVWMPMKRLYARARRHRATEVARLGADEAAAKALDEEERRKWEAPGPVLPVAGGEERMEEVRRRWRAVVGLEGSGSDSGSGSMGAPYGVTSQPPAAVPATVSPSLAESLVANLMTPDFTTVDMWQYAYQGEGMAPPAGVFPPQVVPQAPQVGGLSAAGTWPLQGQFLGAGGGSHYDAVPGEVGDVDMDLAIDFEGFDWQAWQQELRGLE